MLTREEQEREEHNGQLSGNAMPTSGDIYAEQRKKEEAEEKKEQEKSVSRTSAFLNALLAQLDTIDAALAQNRARQQTVQLEIDFHTNTIAVKTAERSLAQETLGATQIYAVMAADTTAYYAQAIAQSQENLTAAKENTDTQFAQSRAADDLLFDASVENFLDDNSETQIRMAEAKTKSDAEMLESMDALLEEGEIEYEIAGQQTLHGEAQTYEQELNERIDGIRQQITTLSEQIEKGQVELKAAQEEMKALQEEEKTLTQQRESVLASIAEEQKNQQYGAPTLERDLEREELQAQIRSRSEGGVISADAYQDITQDLSEDLTTEIAAWTKKEIKIHDPYNRLSYANTLDDNGIKSDTKLAGAFNTHAPAIKPETTAQPGLQVDLNFQNTPKRTV